ncbi:MAG: PAS domain S-box protein, partial [Chloroflexota bacterium]
MNKATLELFKAGDTAELLSNLDRVFTPESHRIFREELIAIAEGQTVFASEGMNRTLAGETIHISLNWSAVQDYEASLSKVIVSLIDITERKRAEAALQESEARYRTLAAASFEGIAIIEKGALLDANDQFAMMMGYDRSELIGKPVIELVAPESRDVVMDAIRSEKQEPYEPFTLRKDGTTFPVEVRGRPMDVGGRRLRVAVIRDITQRKQAEAALRESEEHYRLLFSQLLVGLAVHEMIYDENGIPCDYRFLDVNPAFERLTGLRRDQVIGKTVLEVLPDTEPYWIETYGRVALTGEPIQFENYAKALGKYFDVTAFRPAPGQCAVTFYETTERKQAEAETRKHAAHAEALARTAARLNARLDLDAVLNAVCEETARALNAPLTSVMLCDAGGEMLEQAAAFGRPPEHRQPVRPVPRAF